MNLFGNHKLKSKKEIILNQTKEKNPFIEKVDSVKFNLIKIEKNTINFKKELKHLENLNEYLQDNNNRVFVSTNEEEILSNISKIFADKESILDFLNKESINILTLQRGLVNHIESIFKTNSDIWNYYNNLKNKKEKEIKNKIEFLSKKTPPLGSLDIEYLNGGNALKVKRESDFEFTPERLSSIFVKVNKGKKNFYSSKNFTFSEPKKELDRYDILKIIYNLFNFKSHTLKLKQFFTKKILNISLKINKALFLMNLDSKKRKYLKNMEFNPYNLNENTALVKLILKRNVTPDDWKEQQRRIYLRHKQNSISDFKEDLISKFQKKIQESQKNNLLFE